ncbi:MAG: hypothetical protein ACJ71G_10350 [Nitrososphaeraceae archaeon]
MLYLHQCKQCGLLFERVENATTSEVGEFSRDRKFMVDKCNRCKNFALYNVFGYLSRSG